MKNKAILGRIAYNFSICHNSTDIIFKKMIQQNSEKNKILATRYGYKFRLFLEKDNGNFKLDSIGSKFLKVVNNPLLDDIKESPENGGATDKEINIILNKVSEKLGSVNENYRRSISSIFDIMKFYLDNKKSVYKGIIIPTILYYGKDALMAHQTSIIILKHPHNVILFYEPYGLYKKYDIKYDNCILEFLSIFKSVKAFEKYDCKTYHDFFNFKKGIQGYMIDYGKKNENDFLQKYKKIKKKAVDEGLVPAEEWITEGNKNDKTLALITLMNYASKNPSMLDESAKLYAQYSAKTCVSVFLIETLEFLSILNKTNKLNEISKNLRNFYSKFKESPSIELINQIDSLFKSLYKEKRNFIYNEFKNYNNTNKSICEKLTKVVN